MDVPISEASTRLEDLVRRAEAGEDVVLTSQGAGAVRLTPVRPVLDREGRRRLLERVAAEGARLSNPGPSAARSQDFLYDDDGLPA